MASSRDIVRGLRRDLATAICEAQDIVTPRSSLDFMRCSLAEWRKRERSKVLQLAHGDG